MTLLCFPDLHIMHIFSFLKGFSLAGYSCGHVVVAEEASELYQQMRKVQDIIEICPSRFSQAASGGAINAGRRWVANKLKTFKTSRDAILDASSPLKQVMGGSVRAPPMHIVRKLADHNNDDQTSARPRFKLMVSPLFLGRIVGFRDGFGFAIQTFLQTVREISRTPSQMVSRMCALICHINTRIVAFR